MRFCWLVFTVVALSTSAAQAQGNDLFAPTGGRSALMGNTGVALARDGAAPFYNPAAIVRIRDERLAFSVNFYALGILHFSNFHRPGPVETSTFGDSNPGGTGLNVTTFRVLPSTLCLFFTLQDLAQLSGSEAADTPPERLPRTKLAICFASLESDDVDLQAIRFQGMTSTGPTSQVQSLQRRWSRTYVGPTYSTYLSQHVAVGASLQAVYSYNSFGLNGSSLSMKQDGTAIASTLGTSGSGYSFELTAVLGATYRYDKLTLGASVRVPSLHLFGVYDGAFNRSTAGGDNDAAQVSNATGTMRTAPPVRAAIGGGFVWDKLTLELDGALNIPTDNEITGSVNVTQNSTSGGAITQTQSHEKYTVPNRATFNPSIGAEYFMSPTFSVLFGTSANFSALKALAPALSVGNLVQARTSHVNASAGLGSYWNGGELLFGLQFDYGWGQALAINPYVVPNNWAVVGMQSYGLLFVISGATDLGAILRVVRRITVGEEPNTPPPGKASQVAPPPTHGPNPP
jgi:hypothetical protein